jgi:hypothetical protein
MGQEEVASSCHHSRTAEKGYSRTPGFRRYRYPRKLRRTKSMKSARVCWSLALEADALAEFRRHRSVNA